MPIKTIKKGGEKMAKGVLDKIALVLVIIGAINWGLYGLFSLDLVALVFGGIQILATIVYILVAVSGLYLIKDLMAKKK